MSLVKFSYGSRKNLEATQYDEGRVYFVTKEDNTNSGEIAFDLDGIRSWITSPKIVTVNTLDDSIPKKGELIVVSDAMQSTTDGVVSTYPALKIGDGKTTMANLGYVNEYNQVRIDSLEANFKGLRTELENHIADKKIHHTKNSTVTKHTDDNNYTLEIFNYDI